MYVEIDSLVQRFLEVKISTKLVMLILLYLNKIIGETKAVLNEPL